MKPVIIQTIMRRRRKEVLNLKSGNHNVKRAADTGVGIIFVTLIVLVLGSVAFAN